MYEACNFNYLSTSTFVVCGAGQLISYIIKITVSYKLQGSVIRHVVKRMEMISLTCSLLLDVLLMELRLRLRGLIIDLDELQKLSERGLKLGAETRYDQTSFCCCFKTIANGTEAACTEANFLVGIVVIVLGYKSWRSCVTLSILEFFILEKSCSWELELWV